MIDAAAIGAKVKIGPDFKTTGLVTGICIREMHLQYEVVWWNGDERVQKWLENYEVKIDSYSQPVEKIKGFSR